MYNMQNAAFSPYQTAQGGVAGLEAQGQNMMNMGAELGGRTAGAGAIQGQLLNQGGQAAANSRFNADAYNPWASALQGVGQAGMMYAGGGNGSFYNPSQGGFQNRSTGEVIYPGGTTAWGVR
jgi:hypothetical protein